MMASGVHPEVIDGLSAEEAYVMWGEWLRGSWGVLGGAMREYQSFCILHNLQEITLAANSKNHKPKKPPSFTQFTPELSAFASGEADEEETAGNALTASQTAQRLGITLGG